MTTITRTFRQVSAWAMLATLGAGLMLGGCKAQKKGDLALQESGELRERNAGLDQSNRDKDARIAELETQLANCQPVAMNQNNAPIGYSNTPQASPQQSSWSPSIEAVSSNEFARNDKGEMVATIAGNVLFDSGSVTIRQAAKKKLDSIAGELKRKYSGATIRVEGHTDSDPIKQSKWKTNDALSQARADEVKKYLSSKGVSSSRLEAMGMGSNKPKGTKADSRRVEIVVQN